MWILYMDDTQKLLLGLCVVTCVFCVMMFIHLTCPIMDLNLEGWDVTINALGNNGCNVMQGFSPLTTSLYIVSSIFLITVWRSKKQQNELTKILTEIRDEMRQMRHDLANR